MKDFGNSLRPLGLSASILALQDISKLDAGRRLNGGTLYGGRQVSNSSASGYVSCDCGIVVPPHLALLVCDYSCGAYWCGVLLQNGLLILSVHFFWGMHDNTDITICEINTFMRRCEAEYGHTSTIIGFDANTTLPKAYSDITGHSILDPLQSHTTSSQTKVVEWLASLDLVAHNTFGDVPGSELWTCGRRRASSRRSMIDYVASTKHFVGSAYALRNDLDGMGKCDHRPVVAELRLVDRDEGLCRPL